MCVHVHLHSWYSIYANTQSQLKEGYTHCKLTYYQLRVRLLDMKYNRLYQQMPFTFLFYGYKLPCLLLRPRWRQHLT